VFILKIFQIIPYYPPHIGGMEFFVRTLSEELAARGHKVTVFTTSRTSSQYIRKVNGVNIVYLKKLSKVYNVPIAPSLFWRLLFEEKPDIIHAHQYPVFFSDISAFISKIKKTPLILNVHIISDAKSPLSQLVSNLYYSTLGLHTLRTADMVVVPSLAYKSKISQMNVAPLKIRVIPYGIDTKKFQKTIDTAAFRARYHCQGSKIILSVGRLNYQKGFHYLIQAMPKILKQVPTAKLVIIGEGEQLSFLQELTQSIGVREHVVFAGALSQEEIPEAYSAADVFVLPSLFESFGISLIEAQAAGKPVVGTNAGGAPEALVNGQTGYLVEPGNVSQLVMAVLRLLSDETMASRFGFRGRQFVGENFDFKNTVLKIVDSYNEIAKYPFQ